MLCARVDRFAILWRSWRFTSFTTDIFIMFGNAVRRKTCVLLLEYYLLDAGSNINLYFTLLSLLCLNKHKLHMWWLSSRNTWVEIAAHTSDFFKKLHSSSAKSHLEFTTSFPCRKTSSEETCQPNFEAIQWWCEEDWA